MNRRGFLELLFGATAAALVLPAAEIAWPVESEAMGLLVTPEWVTREVAKQYANSLRFVASLDRAYDAAFESSMGDTVRVRLPEAWA